MFSKLGFAAPLAALVLIAAGLATAAASGGALIPPKLQIISATHHCGATGASDYLVVNFTASGLRADSHYLLESNYKNEVDDDGQLFDFVATSPSYSGRHEHLRPIYGADHISKAKIRATFIAYDFGPTGEVAQPAASKPVVVTIPKCP